MPVLDAGPGRQLPAGPGWPPGGLCGHLQPPLGQHPLPHQERISLSCQIQTIDQFAFFCGTTATRNSNGLNLESRSITENETNFWKHCSFLSNHDFVSFFE